MSVECWLTVPQEHAKEWGSGSHGSSLFNLVSAGSHSDASSLGSTNRASGPLSSALPAFTAICFLDERHPDFGKMESKSSFNLHLDLCVCVCVFENYLFSSVVYFLIGSLGFCMCV